MVPVSFVGVLGSPTVTESSPDIWYLQKRSDLLPRSHLRVVHVLDAASPRTETCTVVVSLMHNVESAGADQLRDLAEPTSGLVLRLGNNQVVAFLRVLRCEQRSNRHGGELLHEDDALRRGDLISILADP